MSGHAEVRQSAVVRDKAQVTDNAHVSGDAVISGSAVVGRGAHVSQTHHVLTATVDGEDWTVYRTRKDGIGATRGDRGVRRRDIPKQLKVLAREAWAGGA